MVSEVAIVDLDEGSSNWFEPALRLIGGIDDLKSIARSVVVKVGVFSHKAANHTSVNVLSAVVNSFGEALRIWIAESDNYRGKGLERLQIWKNLFDERVTPFNLSDDAETRSVRIAGHEMKLSHVLFKPNVFVSTHILRSFERGSVLKNLFGCVSDPKKAKYHSVLPQLLADIYEAIGGIDLAVLDGTHFWQEAGRSPVRMNTLLVGRDAVAVETVGAALAGLNTDEMLVIREFVKRGLGEGDLKKIEILGASFESVKNRFALARRTKTNRRRMRREATGRSER